MFSVKDRPGVLKDALSAFDAEGINLTRIESRPSRKRAWTYVFFADFQGHPEEERVQRALGRPRRALSVRQPDRGLPRSLAGRDRVEKAVLDLKPPRARFSGRSGTRSTTRI